MKMNDISNKLMMVPKKKEDVPMMKKIGNYNKMVKTMGSYNKPIKNRLGMY